MSDFTQGPGLPNTSQWQQYFDAFSRHIRDMTFDVRCVVTEALEQNDLQFDSIENGDIFKPILEIEAEVTFVNRKFGESSANSDSSVSQNKDSGQHLDDNRRCDKRADSNESQSDPSFEPRPSKIPRTDSPSSAAPPSDPCVRQISQTNLTTPKMTMYTINGHQVTIYGSLPVSLQPNQLKLINPIDSKLELWSTKYVAQFCVGTFTIKVTPKSGFTPEDIQAVVTEDGKLSIVFPI